MQVAFCLPRVNCLCHLVCAVLLVAATDATGQSRRIQTFQSPQKARTTQRVQIPTTTATPMQDDANLRDIQFLGRSNGWAVGDRGVIWNTQDGGKTWRLVPSPVECALRKVQFMTSRLGWIAGGGYSSFTGVGYGVILMTNDGGQTWVRLDQGQLPPLHTIEFFGPDEGYAVGETSAAYPVGIFSTRDAGQTWQEVNGHPNLGWRSADFLNPQIGIVTGLRGKVYMVGGQKLLKPRVSNLGKRGLHAVKVLPDETGWLVGDGGLILRTDNGGVVWDLPPSEPPKELVRHFDFQSVDVRGQKIWAAGSPGSIIWHSPDGGQSWQTQRTGQSLPLNQVRFQSETHGWAVGALGVILHTQDGGQTWHVVRGKDRRLAVMSFHARLKQVPFKLLAKLGGDLGYRSMVSLIPRRDIGPDADTWKDIDLRLQQAINKAGGSAAAIGWKLPIARPGLERDRNRLQKYWTQETDGKLREALLDSLVAQIRTWKPSLAVIDDPGDDDATSSIVHQAVKLAMDAAADPTQYIELSQISLNAWQTEWYVHRWSSNSNGGVNFEPYEFLPHMGRTVEDVATAAGSILPKSQQPDSLREVYGNRTPLASNASTQISASALIVGIPPDSPARRAMTRIDGVDFERKQSLAKRQRNFNNYTEKFLDDKRHAGQLIAQLHDIIRGMPNQQAALQLSRLADNYKRRQRWELAESTLVELVEKYPNESVSQEAMLWLFHWWSSSEVAWQRARQSIVQGHQYTPDRNAVRNNIQLQINQAFDRQRQQADTNGPTNDQQGLKYQNPIQQSSRNGQLDIGANRSMSNSSIGNWHDQALSMAKQIRSNAKPLSITPDVQFPLAALLRKRGAVNLAEKIYLGYQGGTNKNAWNATATAELHNITPQKTMPAKILHIQRIGIRPQLDGLLSDECWQTAKEIPIRDGIEEPVPGDAVALAMMCYDNEYLYLGASLPRAVGVPTDQPFYEGRQHDANLQDFDRIAFHLDIDRDYKTFYTIEIDQRGWAAEKCWNNTKWNPKMFIAANGDDSTWRIEVAIPFAELTSQSPKFAETWALGITRTTPGVGVQSWNQPASITTRPETFGLLRFSRAANRSTISKL